MTRYGPSMIWPAGPPLIGMVHLGALPGSPAWGGSMEAVVERARRDAGALAQAGFDGILVENYSDVPFFRGRVPPETVAAITVSALAVSAETSSPVGVNVLRNDPLAALAIAAATSARFIRVNVHTGSMWTDQGLIEGEAAETLRRRRLLGGEPAIFADVHVKHASPPPGSDIGQAAADTWQRGRADALIVSGAETGRATEPDDIRAVRAGAPQAPILVGSGATADRAAALLDVADGLIVGSAIMVGGVAGSGVDADRARAFVRAARG